MTGARSGQSTKPALNVFLSAGEASGEHYGALLIDALRHETPGAQFFGLGGKQMEESGLQRIVRAEDVAHMGITEVLRHAPTVYSAYRRLVKSIREQRPDIAVLIDFPDVNLRLAEHLKNAGVPVVYFVSPQLWAWKKRRIRWVRERVSKMLVIFPFEEGFYRERGVDAEFVGHPLAEMPLPDASRLEFAATNSLDPTKPWLAMLPGSRQREVRLNLPEMLNAVAILGPQYEYLIPVAPTLQPADFEAVLRGHATLRKSIHLTQDAAASLFHARASVVASGTATVLAALMGNPFVAVYRVSPVTYAIASRLIELPHVTMVNLIAGDRIVPELIQDTFTAKNIVRELTPLLADGDERKTQMAALAAVRQRLEAPSSTRTVREGTIHRVAAHVLKLAQ
ncbi:MAG TPA: lipid-A-disaccharide synthase [Acidobacteriaceae bacterium]|nr:lipid-A-disaccharide synthase [Acidobacteriaceae bacterium]